MSTSSTILNIANISNISNPATVSHTSQTSPGKSAESTSDTPFNQALSREMANNDSKDATPVSDKNDASTEQTTGQVTDDAAKAAADATTIPADIFALVSQIGQLITNVTATTPNMAADANAATTVGNLAAMTSAQLPMLQEEHVRTDGKDPAILPDDAAPASSKDLTASASRPADHFAPLMKQASESQTKPLQEPVLDAASGQPTGITLPTYSVAKDTAPNLTTNVETLTQSATLLAPLQQQTVLQHAQALGHADNKLTPQVGTPAWDQALGQKVVWMVAGAQQSASLTLNPPELGPLQVVLNVSNAQATANFIAAQPEVRQALESAMPKLREMLGEAGIQLGQATVSTGTPGSSPQHADSSSRGISHGRESGDTGNDAGMPLHVSHSRSISSGQGLVDTFV